MSTHSEALIFYPVATLTASGSCSLVTMATLSPGAADALRATLPDLADDIIAAIAAEVADYTRAMEGRFGRGVRFGVEVALRRFVDTLAGEPPDSSSPRAPRDTYVRLGAGEYRA